MTLSVTAAPCQLPQRGSQGCAIGPPPLASPFGGGAQCAHWAERAFLTPKKGEGHPWENLLPTGAPLRLSVIEFVGLILGLAGELQSQLAVGDLIRRRQDDGAVGLAAL